MDAILICSNIGFYFIALLPTSIILGIASFLRGSKLWAWFWAVLAILGGLEITYMSVSSQNAVGLESVGLGIGLMIVAMAWMAQLIVIGIVALALRTTRHTATRREEAPPRRRFSWALQILWIGIALTTALVLLPVTGLLEFWSGDPSTALWWHIQAICTPLLPLALAFAITGHQWKAHVWAAFWYLVAVPGAIGLVNGVFIARGALFDLGYVFAAIGVLAAVCVVVTVSLWLARAIPMWRWAFTWATIGYVFLGAIVFSLAMTTY